MKLKVTYSTELAEELRKIHGINADEELERILSFEIAAELKREGLNPTTVKIERVCEGNTVIFYATKKDL